MANTNENNVNVVLTEEGMNTLINKFAKKTDERYLFSNKDNVIVDNVDSYNLSLIKKNISRTIIGNIWIDEVDGYGNVRFTVIDYEEFLYLSYDTDGLYVTVWGLYGNQYIYYSLDMGGSTLDDNLYNLFQDIFNTTNQISDDDKKDLLIRCNEYLDEWLNSYDKSRGMCNAIKYKSTLHNKIINPNYRYQIIHKTGENTNDYIIKKMNELSSISLIEGSSFNINGGTALYSSSSEIDDRYRPCIEMDLLEITKNSDNSIDHKDNLTKSFNGCNLGSTSHRWNNIYAVNGTIQTSDRNKKNSITPLDDEETKNFIMGLIPSHYKMNTGTRTHYGLIAQDVEELLDKLNISSTDFAGFIKSPKTITKYEDEDGNELKKPITEIVEGEYEYSLRYDEFISPMIKMIQMQQNTIETQQKKIDELESRLSKLESVINTTNNETE